MTGQAARDGLNKANTGRINLAMEWSFGVHRSGWPLVLHLIRQLHHSDGVFLDSFVEQNFGWHKLKCLSRGTIPYTSPWCGMFHHPPNMPQFFDYATSPQVILASSPMQESLRYCRGLFVFSRYLGSWLSGHVDCPVSVLNFPTEAPDTKFDWKRYLANKQKKILQVGYWLRKMHSIKHLDARRFKKVWIVPHEYAREKRDLEALAIDGFDGNGIECLGDYEEWGRVNDLEYDELLAENIVFMDLYDSSVNNAVVECIVRNTPVLVNRLSAVVEYLGGEYPLYFDNLDEAARKIENDYLIREAHEYLAGMDKSPFGVEAFLDSLIGSDVYKTL